MPRIDGGSAHNEVLTALVSAAPDDPSIGERIRIDRGSALRHLGLRTPVRRKLVKAGFSFTTDDPADVLAAWDHIWRASDCADVLFAVLDYYREALRREVDPSFWPVAVGWIDRIDNWAHADDLARVYSWALAADPPQVHPQLVRWSTDADEWKRRISLVSLVHYTGKNAVFMSPGQVFPLIENCLDDDRETVHKAVGWVLREMADRYPDETLGFIENHRAALAPSALRRATERLDAATQARLRS